MTETQTGMQHDVERITLTGMRDYRYGEIVLATANGIDVYNTTGLNDCGQEAWDALDVEAIKEQHSAVAATLNGPHWWVMDTLVIEVGETLPFNGLEARWVTALPPELAKGIHDFAPYTVFSPKRSGEQIFSRGKPVYELVSPEGDAYIMQGYGQHVDNTLTIDALSTLGDRLKLPGGWSYRTRMLEEDQTLDYDRATIHAVADELRNIYNRTSSGLPFGD
jgi:hypothetical protein